MNEQHFSPVIKILIQLLFGYKLRKSPNPTNCNIYLALYIYMYTWDALLEAASKIAFVVCISLDLRNSLFLVNSSNGARVSTGKHWRARVQSLLLHNERLWDHAA